MNNKKSCEQCCQLTLSKNIKLIVSRPITWKEFVQCKECGRILDMTCCKKEDELINLSANKGCLIVDSEKET